MKRFNENDTVIYTDATGRQIDTFVIFDTDEATGLTHINHENLKVPLTSLTIHPRTIERHHLPMQDAFSFEIFKKLKEKFTQVDSQPLARKLKAKAGYKNLLAKAS
jgi:hypothetical protein